MSMPHVAFFDSHAITAGPFEFMVAFRIRIRVDQPAVRALTSQARPTNGDMERHLTSSASRPSPAEAAHICPGPVSHQVHPQQDPANVPIVQRWIDKWTWRGYRVLTLVAMMMDYVLPKRTMSWKEAWEVYGEQNGGALFRTWPTTASRYPFPRSPSKDLSTRRGHLPTTTPRSHQLHLDAGRGGDGLAQSSKCEQLRQSTTARYEFWRERTAKNGPLLQQDAAHAVPDLPDPAGVPQAR